jgi:hypothetical protein
MPRVIRACGARRGQDLVELARQVEHHQVAPAAAQPPNRLPGAGEQNRVAHLEDPGAQVARLERIATAPQTDDRELGERHFLRLPDRLADQLGIDGQHGLHHPQVLRAIDEVAPGGRQQVHRELLGDGRDVAVRPVEIDQQHVARPQLAVRPARQEAPGTPFATLDQHDPRAQIPRPVPVELAQRPSHEGRAGPHPHAVAARRETVALDPMIERRPNLS